MQKVVGSIGEGFFAGWSVCPFYSHVSLFQCIAEACQSVWRRRGRSASAKCVLRRFGTFKYYLILRFSRPCLWQQAPTALLIMRTRDVWRQYVDICESFRLVYSSLDLIYSHRASHHLTKHKALTWNREEAESSMMFGAAVSRALFKSNSDLQADMWSTYIPV